VLTLTGSATLADYQTALQSITFDNLTNDNPTDFGASLSRTILWLVDDGTALSDVSSTTINITAQNDSPVLTNVGPSVATDEQTAVMLDADATVSDVDLDTGAGNYAGTSLTIARNGGANAQDSFGFNTAGALFSVSGGNLQAGGLTFATVSIVGGLLTINFTGSGTAATTALVNDVIDHITYTNLSDTPPANVTLDYTFNDGSPGNGQGAGAAGTVAGSTQVNIAAVNDAPVNTVPGPQRTVAAVDHFIAGLAVSDVDAGAGNLTTTLSVGNGILTVASAGGAAVAGSGTASVTLTGTLAQINTTLAAFDNVVYQSAANFIGNDVLTMQTSDGGNTGAGGPLTDTDTVVITSTHALPLLPQGGGHFDADQSGGRLLRHDDGTFRVDDVNALQVTTHVLGAVGTEWSFLSTGDFNGNGISDMLSQRFNDGMLLIHTIDANQVVGSALPGQIGNEWTFLDVGDFNANNTGDLLWQRDDGTLLIHTINNSQVSGSAIVGQIGSEWNFLASADFNHDGSSDLLWQRTDGTLLIHNIMVSGSAILGQIGSEWHFAGTGDLNGDDASDVLWQRDDGTLLIYNINNNQATNAQVVETLAADTQVAGIDDYTGDGTDDIVVRHSDGTFELHQIQANAVTQTVNLGLVTNDWHVI
jgi:hypothetical protein